MTFVRVIILLVVFIIGAVGHEIDMNRQWKRDGKITNTGWVTKW